MWMPSWNKLDTSEDHVLAAMNYNFSYSSPRTSQIVSHKTTSSLPSSLTVRGVYTTVFARWRKAQQLPDIQRQFRWEMTTSLPLAVSPFFTRAKRRTARLLCRGQYNVINLHGNLASILITERPASWNSLFAIMCSSVADVPCYSKVLIRWLRLDHGW